MSYAESFMLYAFKHRGQRQAVWLHRFGTDDEFIHGVGYTWKCSCGANEAGHARPLTTNLLWEAWSHFDAHLDPRAEPLHSASHWYRGDQEPDMEKVFRLIKAQP